MAKVHLAGDLDGTSIGRHRKIMGPGRSVHRDQRIESIKMTAGPSGEARMLVMASLLMADDLYEMRKMLQAAQAGQPVIMPPDPKLGRRLGRLAKRAEEIALDLERP